MTLSQTRIALAASLLIALMALTGCGGAEPAAAPANAADEDAGHGEAGHDDDHDDHDAPERTTLEQGYMETANVEVVYEMVNMIEAQRQFEAYQKVMQTSDALDREATNKIGRGRG